MSFTVWTQALDDAATGWDDQGEALSQARSSLNRVDTALLGPRVAGPAETFLEAWRTEIQQRIAQAEGHADALRAAATSYQRADDTAVAELQKLLPWDDRGLEPPPVPSYLQPGQPASPIWRPPGAPAPFPIGSPLNPETP